MNFLELFLDLLYPVTCCWCQRTGSYLCPTCYEHVEFLPLPIVLSLENQYLDKVYSVARYQPPISNLLQMMKYQHVKGIGQFCGQLLYETTAFPCCDVITTVPLHSFRLDQRGFNQAEEMALQLTKLRHIPYQPLLKKIKSTQTQASQTDKNQRLQQLANVFAFSPPPQYQVPRSCLIIDDVVTTGSTLNECAKVLKAHGFTEVIGLTIAHGS